MNRPPKCQRCHREATNALAHAEGVVVLCSRHHAELRDRLEADRRVQVGRRLVVLDAPVLEGRRR